jgi:hypothetical protein
VLVIVWFGLVRGVVVLVSAVFTRMLVFVDLFFSGMGVLMGMLVQVFVGMDVPVLVRVRLVPMGVLVRVLVGVLVRMQVLVLVFAFHGFTSSGALVHGALSRREDTPSAKRCFLLRRSGYW